MIFHFTFPFEVAGIMATIIAIVGLILTQIQLSYTKRQLAFTENQLKNIKSGKHYEYLDELALLLRNYKNCNFNIDRLFEKIETVKTIEFVGNSLNPITEELSNFKSLVNEIINTYQQIYDIDIESSTERSIDEIHRLRHKISAINQDYQGVFMGLEGIVYNYNDKIHHIHPSALAKHQFSIKF
jgi:hypothetical protein